MGFLRVAASSNNLDYVQRATGSRGTKSGNINERRQHRNLLNFRISRDQRNRTHIAAKQAVEATA